MIEIPKIFNVKFPRLSIMEQKGKFKLYSSEEVLDMHFGKIGTPRRDDFERSVAASVHANEMATRNPYILKNVSHPGTTLDEKLKEMGMSVKEFSMRISEPEETVIAIINGDSSITPELALSLENITKIPTNFWINRQRNYDEYMTSSRKTEPIWNR